MDKKAEEEMIFKIPDGIQFECLNPNSGYKGHLSDGIIFCTNCKKVVCLNCALSFHNHVDFKESVLYYPKRYEQKMKEMIFSFFKKKNTLDENLITKYNNLTKARNEIKAKQDKYNEIKEAIKNEIDNLFYLFDKNMEESINFYQNQINELKEQYKEISEKSNNFIKLINKSNKTIKDINRYKSSGEILVTNELQNLANLFSDMCGLSEAMNSLTINPESIKNINDDNRFNEKVKSNEIQEKYNLIKKNIEEILKLFDISAELSKSKDIANLEVFGLISDTN